MSKNICGLILLLSLLSSCKGQPNPKVWTKNYEQGLYNYLDSSLKASTPDNKERSRYIHFYITEMKQKLPNGINSVHKDILHVLGTRIALDYSLKYGTNNPIKPFYKKWTPTLEKTFYESYITMYSTRYPATTQKFCECIITRLKKIYPDSILLPVPKDVNIKVTLACKNVLQEQ